MKVGDLRNELEARGLLTKGLKSQLVARLSKALRSEAEAADGSNGEESNDKAETAEVTEEQKVDEEEEKPAEQTVAQEAEDKGKEASESTATPSATVATTQPALSGTPLSLADLPERPTILVYPSRTAKSGRFDCSVMSLSLLLDYRQEDNKEHSFEVSLFAELFNEMLIRDFGFNIYRALLKAPEMKEEKKRDKGSGKDSAERKSDRKDDRKTEKRPERRDRKQEDDSKKNDADEDDSDADSGMSEGEGDSEEAKERRQKKEAKLQQKTLNRHLLLSFIYFDQNQCGYLQDKDLEDLFYIMGLKLSRGQVRRLLQKVSKRETVRYRSLTDAAVCPEEVAEQDVDEEMEEEEDGQITEQSIETDLEEIAMGNKTILVDLESPGAEEAAKLEPVVSSAPLEGVPSTSSNMVFHEGAMLDVAKLLRQVERSERARTSSETRLKEVMEALAEVRESWETCRQGAVKTQGDLDQCRRQLGSAEEDLGSARKTAQELRLALQNCRQHLQATLGSLDTVLGRKEHRPDVKKEPSDN